MPAHLRIARPVRDLERSAAQYERGLGWQRLGGFVDHEGFDGVMLGVPGAGHHLELTRCRHHPVEPSPGPEDLLVFYVPDPAAHAARCESLLEAGFVEVEAFNPYWNRNGRCFRDRDGYVLVIARAEWRNVARPA